MAITSKYARRQLMPSGKGAVLVAVVVVLTISLTLFGLWGRAALQRHHRMRTEQWRVQAVRLAEAGVQRGLARHAADSTYKQETWRVPADELGASHAAAVRIRVVSDLKQSTLHCEATAEIPAGALRRAQVTRQIDILISETGDQP